MKKSEVLVGRLPSVLQSLPLGCALPGSTPEQATVLAPSVLSKAVQKGAQHPLVYSAVSARWNNSLTLSQHTSPTLVLTQTALNTLTPDSRCLACFGGIFPHWSCEAHHPLGDVASGDPFITPFISHSDPIIIPFTHFEPSQTAIEADGEARPVGWKFPQVS